MGQIIVQLYEIQTPEEAETVVRLGCDHVGAVLQGNEAEHNAVLKESVETVKKMGAKSSLIPLFKEPERISRAMDYYQPDIVHFCEDVILLKNGKWTFNAHIKTCYERQRIIKERFPQIKSMRTVPIPLTGFADASITLDLAEFFKDISDFFLIDTLMVNNDQKETAVEEQPENGFVGITGVTCDWNVSKTLVEGTNVPVILAGGLSPENVAAGIEKVKPYGVDSCTQTNMRDEEERPVRFRKDPEKVRKFIENTRKMENI